MFDDNKLFKTNMDKILFNEYPQLLKSKKEALDKNNDDSMYNKEKTICLEYLDIWKKEINKIIEETKY